MAAGKIPIGRLIGIFRPIQRWLEQHQGARHWLNVLRLGLFQFGMGLSLAPITGTLNRVLIDEMTIPAVAVGFLVAIHYFVSPARAIIGFQSDQDRAAGRWRTPYIMVGGILTYGGLATAPFSLILLSGEGVLSFWMAMIICTLIFLAYGVGVNIVETIFLALVSDITLPRERGRVLAILWIMLVLGTIVSSIIMGQLLIDYSHYRLIQVMQGSAVVFVVMAYIALFNQERLRPDGQIEGYNGEIRVRQTLGQSLRILVSQKPVLNLFIVLFIATLAFATHDVLLEPYGGQVLQMSISATTQLTALWGVAMLISIALSGWLLWKGRSSVLLITAGVAVGAAGFLIISLSSNAALVNVFRLGVGLIGLGRGLFIVGSVALIMSLSDMSHAGLFLGLWGMMQAIAQGFGTIGGGLARDIAQGISGSVASGYTFVYLSSLAMLGLTLIVLTALRLGRQIRNVRSPWEGLQDVPADQIAF